jgi:type IV pilus assembly protein PilN
MRIAINLATRPFADLGPAIKRLRIAIAALAVVAIGLGIGLHLMGSKADAARARVHSLDGQIASVRYERQSYQAMMAQPDNAMVLKQSGNLNQLFDEKGFSWTLAMEDLETVLPGGVMVTTLEPARDKTGRITLHLRVSGPRDRAIELVSNLEHSRHFLLPRIMNESAESNGGANEKLEPVSTTNRVNFDVLADYSPASAADYKPKKQKANDTDEGAASPNELPSAGPATHRAHRAVPVPQRATPGGQRLPYTTAPLPRNPFPAKPNPGGQQ